MELSLLLSETSRSLSCGSETPDIGTSNQFQTTLNKEHTAVLALLIQDPQCVLSTRSGCIWKSLGLINICPSPFSSLPPLHSLEPAFLLSTHLESWTSFSSGNTVLVYIRPLWEVSGYCYRFSVYSKEHFPLSHSVFCSLSTQYGPESAILRFLQITCKGDDPCKLIRNADLGFCPKPVKLDFYKTHRFWTLLPWWSIMWCLSLPLPLIWRSYHMIFLHCGTWHKDCFLLYWTSFK